MRQTARKTKSKTTLGQKVARYFKSEEARHQLKQQHTDSAAFEAGLDALTRIHKTARERRAEQAAAAPSKRGVVKAARKDATVKAGDSAAATGTIASPRRGKVTWEGPQYVKRQPWRRDEVRTDVKKAARPPTSAGTRIIKQLEALDVRALKPRVRACGDSDSVCGSRQSQHDAEVDRLASGDEPWRGASAARQLRGSASPVSVTDAAARRMSRASVHPAPPSRSSIRATSRARPGRHLHSANTGGSFASRGSGGGRSSARGLKSVEEVRPASKARSVRLETPTSRR